MKRSFITYTILLFIYMVSLIRMKMVLFEMDIWYYYFALLFGVPFFVFYLMLMIARHKFSGRGLWIMVLIIAILTVLGIFILNRV